MRAYRIKRLFILRLHTRLPCRTGVAAAPALSAPYEAFDSVEDNRSAGELRGRRVGLISLASEIPGPALAAMMADAGVHSCEYVFAPDDGLLRTVARRAA